MAPGTYHGYGRQILYGVTIQGPTVAPGADPLVILDGTINQANFGRVLDISLASKASVNLQFLTIQNGKVTNGNGAGIQCYKANLYLNGVVVRQNTTLTGGDGGGIYSSYCDLAVVNSRIEANTAAGWGGGVFVSFSTNPVLIMDSQILNNIIRREWRGDRHRGGSSGKPGPDDHLWESVQPWGRYLRGGRQQLSVESDGFERAWKCSRRGRRRHQYLSDDNPHQHDCQRQRGVSFWWGDLCERVGCRQQSQPDPQPCHPGCHYLWIGDGDLYENDKRPPQPLHLWSPGTRFSLEPQGRRFAPGPQPISTARNTISIRTIPAR